MKRVLVTGGAGAFGTAFVEHLLANHPEVERVAVYSTDEHKHEALFHRVADPHDRVRYFLGDIRDRARLTIALRGMDTVVHAAALKVVPVVEYNPTEAIRTNVDGAVNLVDAVLRTPTVTRVVGLSTDKACSPVNLYGATKLTAERVLLNANQYSGGTVRFDLVRYGNVAGSTGSVIPRWRQAARNGERLRVTHPTMTRYWMTLQQAVNLVVEVLTQRDGNPAVVIPQLPGYILASLAEAVWREHHGPDTKAQIETVGVRPGEKLHESLYSKDESPWVTRQGSRYYLRPYLPPTWDMPNVEYTSQHVPHLPVPTLVEKLKEVP